MVHGDIVAIPAARADRWPSLASEGICELSRKTRFETARARDDAAKRDSARPIGPRGSPVRIAG
jgi:hypothetical protein